MIADNSQAYERHRENMAERQRAARASASEIGPLPEIVDPARRAKGENDLRFFCETYRAAAFHMGWSEDHLTILKRIEKTVRDGGLFGLAMPRGAGKTTITVTAALWALLYGHRKWVCLIGATGPKAQTLLTALKTELRFNALLHADFPDVAWPVQALEGRAARAAGQTLDGSPTNITWKNETITLATVDGSLASGGVVTVAGITGDIRGQQRTLADGRVIRPDYVLLDDPQTRESAKSASQTDDRLAMLNGDILGLAGPGVKISGVMPCTVIQRSDMADQILDRETCPEWKGERTQLLYGMPKRLNDLWSKYQEIREIGFRNDDDGEQANAFYRENFDEMNDGCRAAWDERHNTDELSGIQHAMNLYYRDEAAFYSEFQNQPLEVMQDDTIGEDEIAEKIFDHERGKCPADCELITAFIDVQKEMLFYCVTAWNPETFTGYVIDYGGWPDQGTTNFRYSHAKKKLSKLWPGVSLEVSLTKALTALTEELLGKQWNRSDGTTQEITRLMIDANWGQSRNIVYNFVKNSSHKNKIYPSHGKYVGASTESLNHNVRREPGLRVGTHWRVAKAKDTNVRYCLYDTNYWKSFLFSRLATTANTAGSVQLYKAPPPIHKAFARQMKSEYPVRTYGRGREVDEWKLKPDRPDNHWLDCLVGCCVAASIQGSDLIGNKTKRVVKDGKKKKRRGASYI